MRKYFSSHSLDFHWGYSRGGRPTSRGSLVAYRTECSTVTNSLLGKHVQRAHLCTWQVSSQQNDGRSFRSKRIICFALTLSFNKIFCGWFLGGRERWTYNILIEQVVRLIYLFFFFLRSILFTSSTSRNQNCITNLSTVIASVFPRWWSHIKQSCWKVSISAIFTLDAIPGTMQPSSRFLSSPPSSLIIPVLLLTIPRAISIIIPIPSPITLIFHSIICAIPKRTQSVHEKKWIIKDRSLWLGTKNERIQWNTWIEAC